MAAEVFDFFPLTIFKDKISISKKEKEKIRKYILDSELESKKVIKRK